MAKKLRCLKSIILHIKDSAWEFTVYSPSTYEKMFGPDSEAITTTTATTRNVDFRTDHLTLNTIRHELMHVLVRECKISSSELTAFQMEELCCEIFAEDIYQILILSEKILAELS